MENKPLIIAVIFSFLLIVSAQAQEEQKEGAPETVEAPDAADIKTPEPVAGEETFMPDGMEEPAPVQQAQATETILVDDSVPEGAVAEGNWAWDDTLKISGSKSHTEPAGKGLYGHSLKLANPLAVKQNSNIIQYIYLDPQNPPKGIVLKFKLNNDEEVGVYWEGPEEGVTNLIGDEELLWYQDELPKVGEWVKLEIPASEAEIENEDIVGISYLALDGKVNWDKTAIAEGAAEEDVEAE